MNEVSPKLLIVIFVISLFFTGCAKPSVIVDGKEIEDSQVKIYTSLKDVSESEIESIRREAKEALNAISSTLDVEYSKTIKIKLVDKGRSKEHRGTIYLNILAVRDDIGIVAHEVTHIIARKHCVQGNRFYCEGLAVFIQYRFGDDKESDFFLHDQVIIYREDLIPLYALKHMDNILVLPNSIFDGKVVNRKVAYIEVGSFISFLYETYGSQKFKDLYNSRLPLDYEKIYGKNFYELDAEWLNYVFNEIPVKKQKDIKGKRNIK